MNQLGKLFLVGILCCGLGACATSSKSSGSDEPEELSDSTAEEDGFDDASSDAGSSINGDIAADDDFNFDEFADDSSANEAEASPADPVASADPFGVEPEAAGTESPPANDPPAATEESFAPLIPDPVPPFPEAATQSNLAQVQNLEYRSNANGGAVVITLSREVEFSTRFNAQTRQFAIDLPNTEVPQQFRRPYITKDFKGVIGAINAYQSKGSPTARVIVQMKTNQPPFVQAEGKQLIVLPPAGSALAQDQVLPEPGLPADGEATSPVVAAQTEDENLRPNDSEPWHSSYDVKKAEEYEGALGARTLSEFLTGNNRYFGRPISLEYKDADVREVINMIAAESGVNLVMADDVSGKVTLKLRKVPWDQALVIIMQSKSLGYIRQGNIIRIMPLASLQAETDAAKRIIEAQKQLAPLMVKVFPVSFAKVEDMVAQITPFLTQGRGRVVADARTSSLIITDTSDILDKITRLVKELDLPPAQVLIEAKIVEASENFSEGFAINWGFSGQSLTLSPNGGIDGRGVGLDLNNINVNRKVVSPPSATSLGLRIGTMDIFGDLNAILGLEEEENKIRIISSPRIVTINKEAATISQSNQVLSIVTRQEPQTNNVVQTELRTPVNLQLQVTPQITADANVIMEVQISRDIAGPQAIEQTQSRPVSQRAATTKVLVKNNQTAVIGGIYQSDESERESGTPGLRSLPVIGWLFKNRSYTSERNELVIFLTPRILNLDDLGFSEESFQLEGTKADM